MATGTLGAADHMRHLLILNERDIHHPNAGGAEVNLFQVCRRLVQRDYRVSLLCTDFPGARREETIDGVEVIRLGNRLTYYLRIASEVRRRIREDSVIIEHLCKLPFCSPLYAGRPVIAVTHHLFGRTVFWQAPAPVAAAVWGAELLIPPVYRRCQFIAVSPSTRADLIARGVAAGRIRIIPNGVDCEHYSADAAPGETPPRLLAFGRIEPYKRLDLAVQAFDQVRRALPDARFDIVGGGTGLDELRNTIRRFGLEKVVSCRGPVDESDKLRAIREAHLVVNTSEKEGWGLTVLEAAACSRPTVASNVAGLRDAVIDGQTGVLVRHGDIPALSAALVDLLTSSEKRRRMGEAAREWAQRFSWDHVAEATAACIEEACGASGSAAEQLAWFSGLAEGQS